jgi:ligand-binding sensor domain-containing protein
VKALARYFFAGFLATFSLGLLAPPSLYALNPKKTLSQYTRTVWTQQQGLPQDTIRAITQTADGYLWLGTDEGLARFDGYEFAVFSKDHGELPSNSITTLAAGSDGSLWIGTANGLTRYQDHQFHTYTKSDGLPDNGITDVLEDHSGALWIVAGIYLSRYESGKFTTLEPGKDLPVTAVRTICEDRSHTLWIAGYGGVARLSGRKFVQAISSAALEEDVILGLWKDRHANLWMAGTKGLFVLSPEGKLRKYTARDGLPDPFVRSLWEDRDGNLWAGTNGGLARLEQGRFLAPTREGSRDLDWVRCIYEDREGDLWVGMNSGLNRFRDDVFTIYAKSEGLPSDEPTAVYQDRRGRIWIGFHDSGLVLFGDGGPRTYTTADGMPSNEVFSIREDQRGDLLVSTRDGFSRMHDGHFTNYVPRDSLARRLVFDALEDRAGRLWIATPGGLNELRSGRLQNAIPGGPLLNSSVVVLCPGKDDILWAGTYGQGLWRWQHGQAKLFTTADGLSNDQIRSLRQDPDGTLWIGTFGGGLNRLRDGRFVHYTSKLGLLSDNIAHIEDDGHGSLWLSTTRGICRIAKSQLEALTLGRIRTLTPINYGIEDGLRSAQCAPGYPVGGVGSRTTDGRLWFPTSRGLAVLDPNARKPSALPPLIHMVEMTVDGRPVDIGHNGVLEPGNGRLQIRYTGIHLSAPERVRYSYKLEGLDADWVQAGSRRTINYNSLKHGTARRPVQREPLCFRAAAALLRDHLVPMPAGAAAHGGCLGGLSVAASANPRALRPGAERARPPGPRDPRYAVAGLRRHLLPVGRRGHVHAAGRRSRSPAFGSRSQDGAAQHHRSAPLGHGPARVRSRRTGSRGGAAIRHPHVDCRLRRGRRTRRQRRTDCPASGTRTAPAAHRPGSRDQRVEARRGEQDLGSPAYRSAPPLSARDRQRARLRRAGCLLGPGRPLRIDRHARARGTAGRRTASGQPAGQGHAS